MSRTVSLQLHIKNPGSYKATKTAAGKKQVMNVRPSVIRDWPEPPGVEV